MMNSEGKKKKENFTLSDLIKLEQLAVAACIQYTTKCVPGNKHANKISTIKQKGEDLKFSLQQQGSLDTKQGNDNKCHRRGKYSQKGQDKQNEHKEKVKPNFNDTKTTTSMSTSFAFATPIVILPADTNIKSTTIDPWALIHKSIDPIYGALAFPHIQNTISLTCCLGVVPTIKTVHMLDPVANHHVNRSDGIPSSSKTLIDCLEGIKKPVFANIGDEDLVSLEKDNDFDDMYLEDYFNVYGAPENWGKEVGFPWSVSHFFTNHSDTDM